MSVWGDILAIPADVAGLLGFDKGSATAKDEAKIASDNPIAGLEGIAKVAGDIGFGVTDGKMWRSLGWIVVGAILLLLGVWMLAKGSGAIPNIIPIPV